MGDKASYDAGHSRQLAQGQNCFPLDDFIVTFVMGRLWTCYELVSVLCCVGPLYAILT